MANYPTNSDYAGIGNKGTGDNPQSNSWPWTEIFNDGGSLYEGDIWEDPLDNATWNAPFYRPPMNLRGGDVDFTKYLQDLPTFDVNHGLMGLMPGFAKGLGGSAMQNAQSRALQNRLGQAGMHLQRPPMRP